MPSELDGSAQPFGAHDAHQIVQRVVESVIYNNIVKFSDMTDFRTRRGDAFCNDFRAS